MPPLICITIVVRSQHFLMASVNVTSNVPIQRVEVIFSREINLFRPIKGPLVVNFITIIFHLPETLSIEHLLKISKNLGTLH